MVEEIKTETPKGIKSQKHKGFGSIDKDSGNLLVFLIYIIGVVAS